MDLDKDFVGPRLWYGNLGQSEIMDSITLELRSLVPRYDAERKTCKPWAERIDGPELE